MKRLAIALGCLLLAARCTPAPPSDPGGPLLSFTVHGAGFGTETFGPELNDVTEHWVYDPSAGRTRIHISGMQGDWRAGIDFVLPLSGPGRYRADTSYKGIDRAFLIALADHRTGRRIALVAVDAAVELEDNRAAPHVLTGTFSGRFAVGQRTTGRDVLRQPESERTHATVEHGRFRLHFRDTLHGAGTGWPEDPGP